MNIPNNHQAVMPYLILDQPQKFIDFISEVFGATMSGKQVDENGNIRHCEADINGSTIMFSGGNADWGKATANLFVYVINADETYTKALQNGAKSLMDLSDQSYGRTCGVTDPCDNVWWITSV
jgi:uncharacterized glyoxalase superfamily protein PhnB